MARLRRLVQAPVLIAQALYVIARARRMPEAAGARSGQAGSGPELRVLIVGDSSAAGVGVADQEAALAGQVVACLSPRFRVRWRVIAKSGITTRGALGMLGKSVAEPFDVAVVALGVNDATRLRGAAGFRADQVALAQLLRHRFGVGHIIVSAVPPLGRFPLLPGMLRAQLGRKAEALDLELQRLAVGDSAIWHLPFDAPLESDMMAEDGFHPSAVLYARWGARVAGAIESRRA